MAPRITSTSTFDSIFDTRDGGGANCSVACNQRQGHGGAGEVADHRHEIEHGIQADPADDGKVDRAVHDPGKPIDLDAEDLLRFVDADAAGGRKARQPREGVGGDPADAAIDERSPFVRRRA